jgi:hypothetical protein
MKKIFEFVANEADLHPDVVAEVDVVLMNVVLTSGKYDGIDSALDIM